MELNFQSYVVRFFLWVLSNPEKLSKKAVAAIQNPAHAVFVSAVSSVEITIKQSLGKLQAPEGLEAEIETRGFQHLPLTYFTEIITPNWEVERYKMPNLYQLYAYVMNKQIERPNMAVKELCL
jgi:PIN domain nuclease of toxin-antitoxin system